MTSSFLNSAMRLPPQERLELIDRLWHSLLEEQATLSPEQSAELQRRIDRLNATGPQGKDWNDVKARLLSRTKP